MKGHEGISVKPYIREMFRGNWGYFIFGILQIILMTGTNLLLSGLMQQLVDFMTGTSTAYTFQQLLVFSGLTFFFFLISGIVSYYAVPRFVSRATQQYRTYVFGVLSEKSIASFSKENTSRYLSALSNDANTVESGYIENIFKIIGNILLMIGALAAMLWYSPTLTGTALGLSAIPLIASLLLGGKVANAETEVSKTNALYMSRLKDGLSGFSVVKAFRAEQEIRQLFNDSVQYNSQAKRLRIEMESLVQLCSGAGNFIAQIGIFLIGTYMAITGQGVTAGVVIVFVQLMNYVLVPLSSLPQYIAEYMAAKALIKRTAEGLAKNVREEGQERLTQIRIGIQVKNLSFAYTAECDVLKNISFKFDSGKSYAVVGASGSGKSTFIQLLMAAHNDYTGSVSYDGIEITDIQSESLYDLVSLIQQDVFVFNASIWDNITMFRDFAPSAVNQAIQMAGLQELVQEKGADYICGENGVGLSGGEKQRISIARSLLRQAQVLFVDEATAALDRQTAAQVMHSILRLQDITRIVITHDMDEGLLKEYDTILAIKEGCIIESGTFYELMEQKGYFYSLYTISQ